MPNAFKLNRNHTCTYVLIIAGVLFVAYYANKSNKYNNYISHSFEPQLGSAIVNNNKSCKHFGSCGVVTAINSLADDMGKVITYKVTNGGNTYRPGDVLTKTMDQVKPNL